MSNKDYVRGGYHKNLEKEINRVLIECENLGIFLPTKKLASALVAQKSKIGRMDKQEIIIFLKDFDKRFKKVLGENE